MDHRISDGWSGQAIGPRDTGVRAMRLGLGSTQVASAAAFGFPLTTVRDRDQGRSGPGRATRSDRVGIGRRPEAVREALASG